jgi:hypothetical protein
MRLYDTLSFDDAAKVRYTGDGYLTAMPRVARTGVQLYYGSELGLKGQDAKKVMKVLRPEAEVFATDAMNSFAHRPFTDDHPPVQVDASNWKQYATGQSGAEVVRDGEFVRVPMVLMDAKSIAKFKAGKAEISMGYDCEIDMSSGNDPTYGAYDAVMKNPRGNHYAVVDAARGGAQLRIGDAGGKPVDTNAFADGLRAIIDGKVDQTNTTGLVKCLAGDKYPFVLADGSVSLGALRSIKVDAIVAGDVAVTAAVDTMLSHIEGTTHSTVADGQQKEVTMSKTIMVDGLPVEVVNDQAAAIIEKALKDMGIKLTTADAAYQAANKENEENKKKMAEDSAKHVTVLATKDAEIVTLKKTVEDSVLTPAKLDQLVKDRAAIAIKARSILGDKLVVDGKTDSEIMGQVVTSKLGDAAKDWNADQIKISFDTLTAGIKADASVQQSGVFDTARAFSAPVGDGTARAQADAALADRDARLSNAWKTPVAAH